MSDNVIQTLIWKVVLCILCAKLELCYTQPMLRSRRTLAFSARIQNYLLVLYLFFFLLFFSQLWWSVTSGFAMLLKNIMDWITWTGLGFGILMLFFALWIGMRDRIFPWVAIGGVLVRVSILLAGAVVVQAFLRITSQGIQINL